MGPEVGRSACAQRADQDVVIRTRVGEEPRAPCVHGLRKDPCSRTLAPHAAAAKSGSARSPVHRCEGASLARCMGQIIGPESWARIMGQNHGPESSASVPGENPAPAARHQIHRPDLRDQNPSARSVDKTHLRCRWSIVSMPSRATPLPARDSHATWLCCCKLAFNAAVLTRCLKRRRQPQRQGGIHRLSEARAQSA